MSEDGGRQLFCPVITPERTVFDGEADLVVTRIADGDLGVMADHAPTISTVQPSGETRIRHGDQQSIFATSAGFFRVSENLVQILVEHAFTPEEIDVEEAESGVESAEREYAEASEAGDRRRMKEAERRRSMYENMVAVARRHGEG